MPEALHVAPQEHGVVRVFALDVPQGETARWKDAERPDWPLPPALGVESLAAEDVQVATPSDLAGLGLAGLLAEGYEVSAEQLAPDRAALDSEAAPVAIVRSGAFDRPAELHLAPEVRWLGTYTEPGAPPILPPMGRYESARPRPAASGGDTAEASGAEAEDHDRVFRPDRGAYIRSHIVYAAVGAVLATGALALLGNAHAWVGAVGAALALAARGAYLASEELGQHWALTDTDLQSVAADGRVARTMRLGEIARVRRLGSAVQVASQSGELMLLKYMAEPERVRARLAAAAGLSE